VNWYRWQGTDLLLAVRVQPRAPRDGFGPPLGDEIKIQLRAPPVDERANHQLIAFLAETFDVPRSAIVLLGGRHGRSKRLLVRTPQRLPAMVAPQT